ncbi:MAG: glucosaminidase domain-containing protein [Prolixibacteraceae bacterium]
MKQVLLITISILLFITLFANSQTRLSRREYIDAYKEIAIVEMLRSGIPASITMAQGCLESENGNSSLARKSNNHFGIKCKSDWKGARVYHNDDKLNECFRKYQSVEDSYVDHTNFLVQNPRYAYLFKISHTDYNAWAKGLKAAGYATDPNYAHRLIKIIEDENLALLDNVTADQLPRHDILAEKGKRFNPEENRNKWKETGEKVLESIEDLKIDPYGRRDVKEMNGLEIIYVVGGDTYESIAREFNLKEWEIYFYNDLPKGEKQPVANTFLYLQRKHYIAQKGNDKHVVLPQESMWSISQKYGVKLSRLYRLNRMEKEDKPIVGDPLYLRKRKPKSEAQ